jgi:hypothetical protein
VRNPDSFKLAPSSTKKHCGIESRPAETSSEPPSSACPMLTKQPSLAIPSPCFSISPVSSAKLLSPALRVYDHPCLSPGDDHRHTSFLALTLSGKHFFPRTCLMFSSFFTTGIGSISYSPSYRLFLLLLRPAVLLLYFPLFLPDFPEKVIQPNFVVNLRCYSQFLHNNTYCGILIVIIS